MIPDWTPIDYFRIPNNTLCFPLPPPPEFCVSYCFQNDTLGNMQSWQEHLKTVLHVLLDAKLSNFCGFCLTYHFLTCEKIPFAILLDVSFFSRVKNIVRSSDWLELIYIWKFTTQLFIEYIWSIHMIKESEGFAEMIPYFPPAKVTGGENFHFFATSVWQLIFTLCIVWLKSYPVSW